MLCSRFHSPGHGTDGTENLGPLLGSKVPLGALQTWQKHGVLLQLWILAFARLEEVLSESHPDLVRTARGKAEMLLPTNRLVTASCS